MTTFTLYMPPHEAIVVCTLHPDWQASTEAEDLACHMLSVLNRLKNPVYLILDLSSLIMDMHDVTVLANEISRGQYAFTHHAFMRGFALVSPEAHIALVARGMKTETFGHVPASAHLSLDEALDYIREMMAS